MGSANWLDIISLALILIFGLKGLKSGMIREIFGIIGMIGGFIAAIKYKAVVGKWISANVYNLNQIGLMNGNGTEIVVGFIAALFAIWFISLILGEILAKLLGLSGLGIFDKLAGFVFSSAKIFLIFSILAVFIRSSALLNEQAKPYFQNSIIYPYLLSTGNYLMQLDRDDFKINLDEVELKTDDNNTKVVYESSEENDANATNNIKDSNESKY
ncbi:CvpA family protein [Campylobacter geochelonis]|uniref:CvpA family protein n=1 Tax=Campylobacter geochelonis TaxID=1780362 RepID=A0A128EPM9_9BACT|nr:CvpA family protein [Campylobacter geochelonis]QKF71882.1 CvpA family membrane protein [Campylobacter geochelonis]CZE47079.1 CvpA family protein [Campylobacter geochelonis]CZE47346.1 CvpA family protein [Campylobacter geochelonis]CZE50988.1 CvpA family protein [Campylobacter geochelonis]